MRCVSLGTYVRGRLWHLDGRLTRLLARILTYPRYRPGRWNACSSVFGRIRSLPLDRLISVIRYLTSCIKAIDSRFYVAFVNADFVVSTYSSGNDDFPAGIICPTKEFEITWNNVDEICLRCIVRELLYTRCCLLNYVSGCKFTFSVGLQKFPDRILPCMYN